MSFVKEQEDAVLKTANELLAKENEKRGLKTAEEEYVESRLVGLIEQFRAEFRAEQAKAQAENEAAEREKRFREEQEARRKHIEATRHAYVASPSKVLCERTGDYVLSSVASHICTDGRCVHDAARAFKAGQITKAQFELMVETGQEKTGGILGVAFDAPVDPYAEKTAGMSQPPANPLTEMPQYAPIRLATR